jgi:hypothetical protein
MQSLEDLKLQHKHELDMMRMDHEYKMKKMEIEHQQKLNELQHKTDMMGWLGRIFGCK